MNIGSKEVATASIKMAISENIENEKKLKEEFLEQGILCAAVNFGGDFITSVSKIIERAIVASKREGVITTSDEEGAIAGATREAISGVMTKAVGLNVGGKIGVARHNNHVSVTLYFGIGLLNMNEISIGLGHRLI